MIGVSVRPIDWHDRTAGVTRYTADLAQDDVLIGRVLRSPHPFARIRAIDVSDAQKSPGVRAVVTAKAFPDGARYLHRGGDLSDRAPLARDFVRFVGEEVAAVAAESVREAEAALRLIRVEYEPRSAPFTVQDARRGRARRLHRRDGDEPNVSSRWSGTWGDFTAGLSRAHTVATGKYRYPPIAHVCMEPNVALAQWHGEECLELWASTQAPFFIAKELAALFGLEPDQVICREVAVGGGFGAKSKVCEHEALAAALARAAGRPVLLALDRDEEFFATKPRHAFELHLQSGADELGQIRFFDLRLDIDNGAYNHFGTSVMRVGVMAAGSIYHPDGVSFDARLIDTAKHPGGQFRGFGVPQVAFALESQVDELAESLGLDPIEMRIQNANRSGETTLCGSRLGAVSLIECLETVRDSIGWDEKRRASIPSNRGVGVAAGINHSGAYAYVDANRSDAAVDLSADGRLTLRYGGADPGTGQRTILAQIAATETGLPMEAIDVVSMDTEATPFDMGSWSSRGTHMSGHAVRLAAGSLTERLRELAGEKLGVADIQLENGNAIAAGDRVPVGDLVRLAPEARDDVLTFEASYVAEDVEMLAPDRTTANISSSYPFAAHAAEVSVDRRTGAIEILDYVAAHDVGRAINPTMVRGQIEGGVVMGLGAAMGEELIYEGGRLVNGALINYALPRCADVPQIRALLVENDEPAGPYGAKSVGEMSIIPPAAAIANAVYDAAGVRIRSLPLTPDKVLGAIREQEQWRRRRYRRWRRPSRWWVAFVRRAYRFGLHAVLHRLARRRAAHPMPAPPPLEDFVEPASVDEACNAFEPGALFAGGVTDITLRRRQGLVAPVRLVSTKRVAELRELSVDDDRVVIGGAVTLAHASRLLREISPLLSESIDTIASPQIRNVATVAGNLAQEKRCWFYRNEFPCYKRRGGLAPCYAVLGDHRFYHAALGAHRCQAITPSDLATALFALDAEIEVVGTRPRVLGIESLYRGPGETVLDAGDLVRAVIVPRHALERRGAFEKLNLWRGDFAVASSVCAARVDEVGHWSDVRIVLGAVGPTPCRAPRTEHWASGRIPTPGEMRAVLDDELDRLADPLPGNAWKLDAVAGLVERAAERVLDATPADTGVTRGP